jgi:DNA polymerase III epsilon subunit-like protein
MNKIFYFDVETTGLDAKKNDIIQLAYIIEIDDKIMEDGNIEMQPFNYATVETKALEVSHRTVEMIKAYQEPRLAYKQLSKTFDKYIDKYNKKDKFIPAGYNVNFDLQFLREFWFKNNDKYFGSYFDYHVFDPITTLILMRYKNLIQVDDFHLATICKHFNIEIQAHDALSDIRATRLVIKKVLENIK